MTDSRAHAAPPPPPSGIEFLGTATTLIGYGGTTVLTDPNFLHRGQRAYLGKGLWSKRRTDPARAVDELPPLDAVVLSHLHGDHFDRVARRGLARDVPVLTTPKAARRLRRYGFATEGMRAWDSSMVTSPSPGRLGLRLTAVPARHGRGPVDILLPPVMGSVLEWLRADGSVELTVYVTGDTLVIDELAQVRERFPRIDLALVHLGGTRIPGVRWGLLVTLDGAQGAELVARVAPPEVMPVHLDDYGVFRSPPQDFTRALERRGLTPRVHWRPRGATLDLAELVARRRGGMAASSDGKHAPVTTPDEGLPFAGTAEPAWEHDPERAEEYAESVGADPTPEEIDRYLALEGEPSLAEQADDPARRPG